MIVVWCLLVDIFFNTGHVNDVENNNIWIEIKQLCKASKHSQNWNDDHKDVYGLDWRSLVLDFNHFLKSVCNLLHSNFSKLGCQTNAKTSHTAISREIRSIKKLVHILSVLLKFQLSQKGLELSKAQELIIRMLIKCFLHSSLWL